MTAQPQGRPMHELKAIVRAEIERFWQIGDLWAELTESQQTELIMTAQAMVERN